MPEEKVSPDPDSDYSYQEIARGGRKKESVYLTTSRHGDNK